MNTAYTDESQPDAAQGTEQRTISRVIVLSPKGLGDKRYVRIAQRLSQYAPKLPRALRLDSINKNYFDYDNSFYKNWIYDDRSLLTRLKLRLNLGPNKQDFGALYDQYFTGNANPRRLVRPGEHACAIAHITAWQSIRETDDLCLILEDDAILLPGLDATACAWPKGAHLVHLMRPHVRLPHFDSDFQRLPRRRPCYVTCTAAYLISHEGANLLLNKMLPISVGAAIDCSMFSRQCDGLRAYVARRPFASLASGGSLINSSPVKTLLTRLASKLSANPNSRLSTLAAFIWRKTPRFVKDFIRSKAA